MNKKTAVTATLLSGALLFFSFHKPADNKKGFVVKGHIRGLTDSAIYLAYGTLGTMKADTARVVNGSFVFKGSVKEPLYGMLFNKNYSVKVDMFVDNGAITINGSVDSVYDVKVSGPAVVNEFAKYNQQLLDTRKPVQTIYEQMLAAYKANDSVALKTTRAAFDSARNLQTKQAADIQMAYIKQHPHSPVSAWELVHIVSDKNLEESSRLFNAMDKTVQQSSLGQEIATRIKTLSSIVTGKQAPAFTQQSVQNQPVSLSSYAGKYVLLEFWASWCGPCRAENPNLRKDYQQYHQKGFEVLAVSLDHVKENWEKAIAQDSLPWTHVSDLKGWKNEVGQLYGVNAVPANFLIDPSGKIIAQNLRGEALNKKLAEIWP
ncbi:peroxiredoxin [Filimonas zeae]|uniref:Thiol:disulfide interchange protein n=1 Tax=Filimonas zeae TaxID=1737353 RepID=A0A917IQC5_9BACT|nr:TlpA disulfide reductase family protein [Filimonas zeae]MDR6337774.1 peroxiredoxin [Filimonas zeae]GGH60198.1 thiol:disulfide interchange protein [Filimonas zeae]